MPLTPLALSPVSKINYRNRFKNSRIFMGNNFEVTISPYGTSPATSAEETLINRSYDSDNLEKIYTTKKFLNLSSSKKIQVIQKYDPEVFEKVNKLPTDNIISPFNLNYIY
jgi:hypothetical protein